jgi:ADP-ribosylglycohydrolase
MASAIRTAHDDLAACAPLDAAAVAARYVPDHVLAIVPLALALATILTSADEAILLATNVGGDSDSVASIAGGILGARHPASVNAAWYEIVRRVNDVDTADIASQLIALRQTVK